MGDTHQPASALLQAGLLPGERILWTGRPDRDRLIQLERKWLPGGLACIVLAVWIAWRADALLVSLLVLAFGLNALTLPLRAARAADGILYAVTDRCVRIVDRHRLDPMQSWPFQALRVQVRQAPDAATGDLRLRRRDYFPAALEGLARQRRPIFFAIEQPEQIAEIIRNQARLSGFGG